MNAEKKAKLAQANQLSDKIYQGLCAAYSAGLIPNRDSIDRALFVRERNFAMFVRSSTVYQDGSSRYELRCIVKQYSDVYANWFNGFGLIEADCLECANLIKEVLED